MRTFIIENEDVINRLTSKDIYKKILLHIDDKNKTAKFESDYTKYDLTEVLDYNKACLLIESM